jgi:hypothetical protein
VFWNEFASRRRSPSKLLLTKDDQRLTIDLSIPADASLLARLSLDGAIEAERKLDEHERNA